MWYVCDVLYAVLYVRVSCFVMCGCVVSRRYINACNCNIFSVGNVYLDKLKLCELMVECMSVVDNVMLFLMSIVIPPPALRGSALGFTNPVRTGGVLNVCLCLGCGGVCVVGE